MITAICPMRGNYVIDVHQDPKIAYFGTVVAVEHPDDLDLPTRLKVQIVNLNNEMHWVDHIDVAILENEEFRDLCIEVEGTDRALKRATVWPNPFFPAKKSPWLLPEEAMFDVSSWVTPGEAILTPEAVRESKGYTLKDLEELKNKTWERVHVPVEDTTYTFHRWLPGDTWSKPDKDAERDSKTPDRVSLAIPRKRAQKHLTVRRRTRRQTTERRR